MTTIRGLVRNTRGESVGDVFLAFVNRSTGLTTHLKSQLTGDYNGDISPGEYTVVATAPGYQPRSDVVRVQNGGSSTPDHNVELTENGSNQSPVGSSPGSPPASPATANPANGLLGILEDRAFNIEADINERETIEAIRLFARVNLILGTIDKTRFRDEKGSPYDIFGIHALTKGLENGSLESTIIVNPQNQQGLNGSVWDVVKTELPGLDNLLISPKYQNDIESIEKEAKRQFNLGTTNNVLANTQFPSLFNRYVDIAADPRLSFDIRAQKHSDFSDKIKVYEAIDLLRELKQVILQLVRSLSRYGTIATEMVNKRWGELAEDALAVLKKLSARRSGNDQDELTTWATLALITGKDREAFFPYITLARHGTKLLIYAKEIYDLSSNGKLEDFEEDTLLDLFQPENQEFYTTKLRREAYMIRRHQLQSWR